MNIFFARDDSWKAAAPDNSRDAAVIPVGSAQELATIGRARSAFPNAAIVAVLGASVRAAEAVRAGAHATAPASCAMNEEELLPIVEVARAHKACDDARDEALSAMSHELRNPLNVIAMTLAYVEEATDLSAPKRRAHMQKVDRSVARMIALLDDVADASHLARGDLHFALVEVSATRAIESAVHAARSAAEARGVALSSSAPVPLAVRADPDRLTKVLGSAIHRVLATAAKGTTLRVEASDRGPTVEIAVLGGAPGPIGRGASFSLDVAARLVEALGGRAWEKDDLASTGALRLTLPKA